MNQEIKDRWVTALRSGEYKQGEGHLRTDDKFCCLGVLCDLAVKDGVIAMTQREDGVYVYDVRDTGTLPPKVMKWSGVGDVNPKVTFSSHLTEKGALAALNDGISGFDRHTFSQIADLIEHQL